MSEHDDNPRSVPPMYDGATDAEIILDVASAAQAAAIQLQNPWYKVSMLRMASDAFAEYAEITRTPRPRVVEEAEE